MQVEGTLPIQEVTTTVQGNDRTAAVKQFLAEHPKARVEAIDGVIVRGVCRCGTPIMMFEKGYVYDTDTERYICAVCAVKGE